MLYTFAPVIFPIVCLNTPSAIESIQIRGHGTQCTELAHAALFCFNIYLTLKCMMQEIDIADCRGKVGSSILYF